MDFHVKIGLCSSQGENSLLKPNLPCYGKAQHLEKRDSLVLLATPLVLHWMELTHNESWHWKRCVFQNVRWSENTTPTTFSKNFALRSHCIILLLAANEMIIISSICAKLGVFIHKNQDANLRVLLAFLKVWWFWMKSFFHSYSTLHTPDFTVNRKWPHCALQRLPMSSTISWLPTRDRLKMVNQDRIRAKSTCLSLSSQVL